MKRMSIHIGCVLLSKQTSKCEWVQYYLDLGYN